MELQLDATKAVLSLRGDGAAIAAASRRSGLEAAVPSCPGWSVADLLNHLAMIYATRTMIVRDGLQTRPTNPEPPEGDPLDWFESSLAELVKVLRTSDLTRELWTFIGPKPASWWTRRMAHETAIHRADAELAAGGAPPRVDAIVAIDGIDEVLTVFLADALPRWGGAGAVGGGGETVGIRTPDERWHVTLHADSVDVVRGSAAVSDALVAGTPSHVLYHLWGRLPADEVDVRGDDAALTVLRRALKTCTGG